MTNTEEEAEAEEEQQTWQPLESKTYEHQKLTAKDEQPGGGAVFQAGSAFRKLSQTRIPDETGEQNLDPVNEKWRWLRSVLLQTARVMCASRPATPTSNGRGERQ